MPPMAMSRHDARQRMQSRKTFVGAAWTTSAWKQHNCLGCQKKAPIFVPIPRSSAGASNPLGHILHYQPREPVELIQLDVRHSEVADACAPPAHDIEALALIGARCGVRPARRSPGEQVDDMLVVAVHHRRGRVAVDVIYPAATSGKPSALKSRTGGETSICADSHGLTVCSLLVCTSVRWFAIKEAM